METSLQIALAEINENVRENYLQAYTTPAIMRFINEKLAQVLHTLFACYRPEDSEEDFYQLEIGTSGIIRSYMSVPCSETFPLELKIRRFLEMSLLAYSIPEEERMAAIDFVSRMDVRQSANKALQRLFKALSVKFQFTFTDEH